VILFVVVTVVRTLRRCRRATSVSAATMAGASTWGEPHVLDGDPARGFRAAAMAAGRPSGAAATVNYRVPVVKLKRLAQSE